MSGLKYTLLADGTSDRMLDHVIGWAIRRRQVRIEQRHWADLSFVRPKPKGLTERIQKAVELYPCDVLFNHRDAEGEPYEARLGEIQAAVTDSLGRYVPIIPVHMTEA